MQHSDFCSTINSTSGLITSIETSYWLIDVQVGLMICKLLLRQGRASSMRSSSVMPFHPEIMGIKLLGRVYSRGHINVDIPGVVHMRYVHLPIRPCVRSE